MKISSLWKRARAIYQVIKKFWKELKEAITAGQDLLEEITGGGQEDEEEPPGEKDEDTHILDPAYPDRSEDIQF